MYLLRNQSHFRIYPLFDPGFHCIRAAVSGIKISRNNFGRSGEAAGWGNMEGQKA